MTTVTLSSTVICPKPDQLPPHLKSNIHCWIPCPSAHLDAGFGFPSLLLIASSAFSWTHFCLHPFSHSRSHCNRLLPLPPTTPHPVIPLDSISHLASVPLKSMLMVPAASKVHKPPHGLASTRGSGSPVLTWHWPRLWLRGPGPQKAEAEQVPSSPGRPPHRPFPLPIGPSEPEFPPSHLHCTPCSRESQAARFPRLVSHPGGSPSQLCSPSWVWVSGNFRVSGVLWEPHEGSCNISVPKLSSWKMQTPSRAPPETRVGAQLLQPVVQGQGFILEHLVIECLCVLSPTPLPWTISLLLWPAFPKDISLRLVRGLRLWMNLCTREILCRRTSEALVTTETSGW